MLLKACTVIYFLMYISRPAIMPVVNQDKVVSLVNTQERSHPFVKKLEEKLESYEGLPQIDVKEFHFLSCQAFEKTARLTYFRNTEKKDKTDRPQVEFLYILFILYKNEWKISNVSNVFAAKLEIDDHSAIMEKTLEEHKENSILKDEQNNLNK